MDGEGVGVFRCANVRFPPAIASRRLRISPDADKVPVRFGTGKLPSGMRPLFVIQRQQQHLIWKLTLAFKQFQDRSVSNQLLRAFEYLPLRPCY